jgi:hypothetical protein
MTRAPVRVVRGNSPVTIETTPQQVDRPLGLRPGRGRRAVARASRQEYAGFHDGLQSTPQSIGHVLCELPVCARCPQACAPRSMVRHASGIDRLALPPIDRACPSECERHSEGRCSSLPAGCRFLAGCRVSPCGVYRSFPAPPPGLRAPALDAAGSHDGLSTWADRDVLMDNLDRLLSTAADALQVKRPSWASSRCVAAFVACEPVQFAPEAVGRAGCKRANLKRQQRQTAC